MPRWCSGSAFACRSVGPRFDFALGQHFFQDRPAPGISQPKKRVPEASLGKQKAARTGAGFPYLKSRSRPRNEKVLTLLTPTACNYYGDLHRYLFFSPLRKRNLGS